MTHRRTPAPVPPDDDQNDKSEGPVFTVLEPDGTWFTGCLATLLCADAAVTVGPHTVYEGPDRATALRLATRHRTRLRLAAPREVSRPSATVRS
ncbi:hypothetical protein ACFC1T_09365 [Kitasatospora sp. NPDC056076]|uniref:hypothetical protein n=1 Tax=Kitasatospora sp. NPDC056076 TaxID=3345703 RepID=UPI0035D78D16